MATTLLLTAAIYSFIGIVGSEMRALADFRAGRDHHRASLRNGIYVLGFALSVGFIGLIA